MAAYRVLIALLAAGLVAGVPGKGTALDISVSVVEYSEGYAEIGDGIDAGYEPALGSATASLMLGNGLNAWNRAIGDARAFSFGDDTGQFGGYVVTPNDSGFGKAARASGFWEQNFVRNAETTTLPFRISNTKLQIFAATRSYDMSATFNLTIRIDREVVWSETAEVQFDTAAGTFIITAAPAHLTGTYDA